MKFTYIPDFFSVIMYFGLVYFTIMAIMFILNRFVLNRETMKVLNRFVMFFSLGYALLLFSLFFIRGVMAGFYHDEQGTSPSDMELMFNYFHIVYSFVPLIFAYILDKKE